MVESISQLMASMLPLIGQQGGKMDAVHSTCNGIVGDLAEMKASVDKLLSIHDEIDPEAMKSMAEGIVKALDDVEKRVSELVRLQNEKSKEVSAQVERTKWWAKEWFKFMAIIVPSVLTLLGTVWVTYLKTSAAASKTDQAMVEIRTDVQDLSKLMVRHLHEANSITNK